MSFFIMKTHVKNSYIRKIHKQSNINYDRYYFKNYYYFFGKKILVDPGAVSWVKSKKEPREKCSRSGERAPGMLPLTNQC